MSVTISAAVELQFQVERLLARYAQCIDEDRLEDWPAFFTEQCLYRVISRENAHRKLPTAAMFCDSKRMLIDRVVSARHANVYEKHTYLHLVGNTLVNASQAPVFSASSNYAVYRTRTNGVSEIFSAGRYLDHIVCHDGEWLFQEKQVVFDTHRVDSLLVTPL